MSNMAQTYELPENIEKAVKLLTEKIVIDPAEYVAFTVKAGIEADLDDLSDDHGLEDKPFYFTPKKHLWITWLSECAGYETPEDFIIRCVRERVDHIKLPADGMKSLDRMEEAAGIPNLRPFKEQVKALLDMK